MSYRVTVIESFNITGRGVAVVFSGSLEHVPLGVRVPVVVRSDGSEPVDAWATVELMLRQKPKMVELPTLLILGLSSRDVPRNQHRGAA